MTTPRHQITVSEAVQLTGLTRRTVTYAVKTGKLSASKLPGRTGPYLLDIDEVRRYAEMAQAS